MPAGPGLIFLFGGGTAPVSTIPSFTLAMVLDGGLTLANLTDRLMAFESRWGREDEFSGVQPGTLTLSLDNDDGALDVDNAASPYYGDLDLNTQFHLQAHLGGLDHSLGYGYADDFTAEPLVLGSNLTLRCTDFFQQLQGKQVTASFPAQLEGARIITLLDNAGFPTGGYAGVDDGLLTLPAAALTDTPLTSHLDTVVRAAMGVMHFGPDGNAVYHDRHWRLRQASLGVFGAGGTYPIPTPTPTYNRAGVYNQARMTRGGGGVNEVQRITISGSPTAGAIWLSFEGQATGPTLGWNSNAAAVQAALQALSTIGSGNVSCSGGPFPATPIDVTFTGTLAQQNVPLLGVTYALSGGTASVAEVTTGVEPSLEANDTTSQTKYGLRTYILDDDAAALLPSDVERQSWLSWLVSQHATPHARFNQINIDPYGHTSLWNIVISADIGQRITLTHDLPGSKGTADQDYFIEGIAHRAELAGPNPLYGVQWNLSRAEHNRYWLLNSQVQLGVDTRVAY